MKVFEVVFPIVLVVALTGYCVAWLTEGQREFYDFEVEEVRDLSDHQIVVAELAVTNFEPFDSFRVIDTEGNAHRVNYNQGLQTRDYGWFHTVISSKVLFDLPRGAVYDHIEYVMGDNAEHADLVGGI